MLPARPIAEPRPDEIARFLSYATPQADGCWRWMASCFLNGYGRFTFRHNSFCAHRIAYVFFCAPLDEWTVLDHLCRNRRCVNPEHLEPVTVGENIRRGDTGIKNWSKTHCIHGH